MDWIEPLLDMSLSSDDLHIWRIHLNRSSKQLQALWQNLSQDEQDRAEKFYFDRDKSRYVVTRGVLREILGRYLNLPPVQIQFQYSEYGKPSLNSRFGNKVVQFNVTHSHDVALIAFCQKNAVGVDVEKIRPLSDARRIAARFFSDYENEKFNALPENHWNDAFFNCWTRKEAFIKAVGEGLSYPLNQFDVTLSPKEPTRFVRIQGSETEAARWSLYSLNPAPDYVAAVAVMGQNWQLSCWSWPKGSPF